MYRKAEQRERSIHRVGKVVEGVEQRTIKVEYYGFEFYNILPPQNLLKVMIILKLKHDINSAICFLEN